MRVLAADWSGAAVAEQRHLVVAEADPETGRLLRLVPATRAQVTARVLDGADAGDLVAGLDFSFSLPRWWLSAQRIASVDELWADGDRLERWLAAGEAPFWGRPGRRRPGLPEGREYRATELAATRRPRSTFQIGGAGAVGTAALRGMPHLGRLRRAGIAVWPWDPWLPPVVVEVWPRLALGAVVKSSPAARAAWAEARSGRLRPEHVAFILRSDDALDAAAAALDLAASWARPRPRPDHEAVELEGWIDGVAAPAPARR